MSKLASSLVVCPLAASPLAMAEPTIDFASEQLAQRTIHRRAVDAVIWGVPPVDEDVVKQAYFRDGKASCNDIVWWPNGDSGKLAVIERITTDPRMLSSRQVERR